VRSFVALPLPDEVRGRVVALQARARAAAGAVDVRWSAPASMHLTLKFLGEVAAEQVAAVEAALGRATAGIGLPSVALAGLGAFPRLARGRVLWLGVTDGAAEIGRLAAAIEREVAPLGFEPEPQPFTAHLTLGRVRAPRGGADLRAAAAACGAAAAGAWRPDAVVLYESHLGRGGARHERRAAWPLG
jgi:2'-5' RNA ligase